MYQLASASIKVLYPADDTFYYATNLENFASWFPGVINICSEDDLPPCAIGKIYRETVAIPLRGQRSVEIRVVEARPPVLLVTEGTLPGLWPRMEIEVKALEPSLCEVHWRMRSRNQSLLARWTLLPCARSLMQRRAAAGLLKLKTILEVSAE